MMPLHTETSGGAGGRMISLLFAKRDSQVIIIACSTFGASGFTVAAEAASAAAFLARASAQST
jgi:hypothetical protein